MIKKIEIMKSWNDQIFISRAWNQNDEIIIDENSDARPSLVIENETVVDILFSDLNIEIPEFSAFLVGNDFPVVIQLI